MKKLVMLSVLVIAQIASAQVAKKANLEVLNRETARTTIVKTKVYSELEAIKAGKVRLGAKPAVVNLLKGTFETSLKGVKSLTLAETNQLMSLAEMNPKEVLAEIARIASVAKSSTASAKEKAQAKKSLGLIIAGSLKMETLNTTGTISDAQRADAKTLVMTASKVAEFDYNAKAIEFSTRFENALRSGNTVENAVMKASDKKIALKDILNCAA